MPRTVQEYIDETPMWADSTAVRYSPMTNMQWLIWGLAAAGKFFEGMVVFTTGVALPLMGREFALGGTEKGVVAAASLFGILIGATALGVVEVLQQRDAPLQVVAARSHVSPCDLRKRRGPRLAARPPFRIDPLGTDQARATAGSPLIRIATSASTRPSSTPSCTLVRSGRWPGCCARAP